MFGMGLGRLPSAANSLDVELEDDALVENKRLRRRLRSLSCSDVSLRTFLLPASTSLRCCAKYSFVLVNGNDDDDDDDESSEDEHI
jgi:hypothetical protein